eukprot:scaffold255317_cov33-Tisochrysis_lutea.AAC.2
MERAGDVLTSKSHGLRSSSTMMSYPSSSKQPPESGTSAAIESNVRQMIARMRAQSNGELSGLFGLSRSQCLKENLHPTPMPSLLLSRESECLLIDELVK